MNLPKHIFLKEFACKYGLHEAIVVFRLHVLLKWASNNSFKSHYHDGYVWVWNSYASWQSEHFPFLSERQVRSAFLSLKRRGFVKTRQQRGYDRSFSYTIDYMAMGGDAPGSCPWDKKRNIEATEYTSSMHTDKQRASSDIQSFDVTQSTPSIQKTSKNVSNHPQGDLSTILDRPKEGRP